jgi:hypothetical protein
MIFLHSYGMSTSCAVRIDKAYGDNANETVRANPYTLSQGSSSKTRSESLETTLIRTRSFVEKLAFIFIEQF